MGRGITDATADALLSTGSGRIILGACREDRTFLLSGGGRFNLFAQALVDALRGEASCRVAASSVSLICIPRSSHSVKEKALLTIGREQHPELTVLKGVGPFAVALYRGAPTLTWDWLNPCQPPKNAAVRPSPEKSQRLYQQFVVQTGGVNFGQDNYDHYRWRRNRHPGNHRRQQLKGISTSQQARWSRSSAIRSLAIKSLGIRLVAIKYADQDRHRRRSLHRRERQHRWATLPGAICTDRSPRRRRCDHFMALLQQLRIDIQTAGLPDKVRRSVEFDLEIAEEEASGTEPDQSIVLLPPLAKPPRRVEKRCRGGWGHGSPH